MAKVFVSYSRKDSTFAKRLTAELQKGDLDFWIDWEGIPPTVDWWKEIEKGIEEADIFLFLISPDSAKSKICGKEIDTAVKNGKRIIPVVVREIEWQDTPPQLGHLNYIFFSRDDDFDTAVKKLMTAIQSDYEWAATHRRLQVKALDWERNGKDNGFLLRGMDLLDAEQDLAMNTSKEPHPTDLQREYVFKSRKAADRQRRITTWIAIVTAVALAALAGYGFYQADVAKKQANIALSGKLAAQAEILIDKDLQKALLLGIESNRILESNHIAPDALARGAFLDVVNTNRQLFQFLSPDEPANEVALSPTSKLIAFAHAGKILLWDIPQGKQIGKLESKDSLRMRSVAYSPDGEVIAAGACNVLDPNGVSCNKGIILLWDAKTYQQTGHLYGDVLDEAPRIYFSPDGEIIASIISTNGREATVSLWDIQTGSSFEPEVNKDSILSAISFSRDGKTLALGDSISYISLWDVVGHRKIRTFGEGTGIPGSIFFSPDGRILATSGGVLTPAIRFWDVTTGDALETIPGQALIAVNDERDIQLTRDNAGKLIVWKGYWDQSKREAINELPLDPLLYRLILSPDGKTLAEINDQGDILLWDTTTGTDQGNYRTLPGSDAPPDNIAFGADSNTILSVGYGELLEWNVLSNSGPTSKKLSDEFDQVLDISSDGTLFMARDYDSAYTVRDTVTGQLITRLQAEQLLIDKAVLSNDQKMIATSSCAEYDRSRCISGKITLWHADTGARFAQQFGRHFTEITSLAFHPENGILAIGDGSQIRLWEISNYQPTGPSFTADVVDISHLTFSPDGEILAATANDRSGSYVIVLWDVKTGQTIGQPLVGGSFPLAFSPDGKILVSGHASEDGTIRLLLWDMDIQSWKEKSCQRAGRNFTRDEWAQYLLDLPYPTNVENATCPQWPLDGETTSTPPP